MKKSFLQYRLILDYSTVARGDTPGPTDSTSEGEGGGHHRRAAKLVLNVGHFCKHNYSSSKNLRSALGMYSSVRFSPRFSHFRQDFLTS